MREWLEPLAPMLPLIGAALLMLVSFALSALPDSDADRPGFPVQALPMDRIEDGPPGPDGD